MGVQQFVQCTGHSAEKAHKRTSKEILEDTANIAIKFCSINIWKKIYVKKRMIHYNYRKSGGGHKTINQTAYSRQCGISACLKLFSCKKYF